MRPLPAADVLERYFLEARCKLLDVAAILDRVDRGGGAAGDPRLENIRRALAILQEPGDADRAEKVQQVFSLPYEPDWQRPTPRP